MTPLVAKLSGGKYPVALTRYKGVGEVKEAIDRGVVLVKFTETQGGTELGVWLDDTARKADLSGEHLDLTGTLTLDYQPVKCIVSVNLQTLSGHGCLEPIAA